MFKGWKFGGKKFWKILFWSSGLRINVFEKLLNSFSCISFMKLFGLSCFCIIFCSFSKIQISRIFINWMCFWQIENPLIFNHCSLSNSIGIRSMLDRSKLKIFQFLSFWPICLFMHHLCLGFIFIALSFVSILHFCSHISHCIHI